MAEEKKSELNVAKEEKGAVAKAVDTVVNGKKPATIREVL